jgi:CheY-like chemotaxis protein
LDGQQACYTLLGDQPNITTDDSLGFDRIAGDLAELIVSSAASTPFTLGIEAGWGQGKSSLMGRIERNLREHEWDALRVTTVSFNAWTAGDGDVLEGLVKSVLDQLDEKILRRLARKRHLISWLRALGVLVTHGLGVGSIVDRLWTELHVDPKTRNEMRDLMANAMRQWRDKETVLGHDRLLVIFIDDLDRCSPENVFQVFEAMKLYLDAPGLVFVVGFDAGIVSDAVLHEKKFSKELTGDRYLEKVIQIRYRIPLTSDSHTATLMEAYMRDSRTEDLFDQTAQTLVVERNTRNPRRIKRFINSFILEYQIDDEWAELGAETLIRMLILDFYFREFAQLLYGRAKRDPIREFLDYVTVKDLLAHGVTSEAARQTTDIFKSYGLVGPEDHAGTNEELLEQLERELPEPTLALVGDSEFATLLEGFGDEEARGRLRAKLQRRSTASFALEDGAGDEGPVTDLSGMRILWIDDDHPGNTDLAAELGRRGAIVLLANGYENARVHIIEQSPDVILSDVTRYGDESAGFEDLERLRRVTSYDGPAIFFTSRITPIRRELAHQLNATITNSPQTMFSLIGELAPTRRPAGFPKAKTTSAV